jgi:hypothetical protein
MSTKNLETITKAFATDVRISSDDARTVTATASTAMVDHEGEVLVPGGCSSKVWEKNPTVFFIHEGQKLPVARGLAIERTDDSVRIKFQFMERPPTLPEAQEWVPDTLWWMFKNKGLNAVSVGFIPKEGRAATAHDARKYGEECQYVHSKWTLLELSIVPLPCNPEALVEAVSKGILTQAVADKLLKPADKMVRSEEATDDGEVVDAAALVKGLRPRKADDEVEPLARTYTQYTRHGNTYEPAPDIRLEPALGKYAYRVIWTWSGVGFQRMKPQTDELYKFDNSVMTDVLGEIDRFWDLKADYDKLGLMHNRGVLMYGPPGMGKTSIINQVSDMIVGRGDVVLYAKKISTLVEGLKAFREVEPDRKAVVALEDADEYIGYEEREFLQLLDGEQSINGVLYLATTNYLERFPARLLRPGRFDKQVYVGSPPYEGRLAYLTNKLKDVEKAREIERLARETDGMSFGHLRELITAVYALKEPVNEVLARLQGTVRPRKDFGQTLMRMKAAGMKDEQYVSDATEGDAPEREVHREIESARRVVASVEVAQPEVERVKYVHRFIEPSVPDVATKTRKAVIREIGKRRGRIYGDE